MRRSPSPPAPLAPGRDVNTQRTEHGRAWKNLAYRTVHFRFIARQFSFWKSPGAESDGQAIARWNLAKLGGRSDLLRPNPFTRRTEERVGSMRAHPNVGTVSL